MLAGAEIRSRVHEVLATGRLWRLTSDRARLVEGSAGGPRCHICGETIAQGQAFGIARPATVILAHM